MAALVGGRTVPDGAVRCWCCREEQDEREREGREWSPVGSLSVRAWFEKRASAYMVEGVETTTRLLT